FIHHAIGQLDRQQAVLEAVVVEDVGKRWSEDRPEPVIGQRPRGVFATGTATKIASRQQDAGPAIFRPVEFELGVLRAVLAEPPVEEQELTKAGPLNPLEKLLGNDLVGI